MRFEEAKDYIKQQLPFYLEGKGISTKKNFCCLNPEHPDTNPSMSYDPKRNKCHCFSCNANYDIFDLIAIDYSLDDKGAFKKALELYRVTIDSDHAPTSSKPAIRPTASQKTAEPPHTLPITAPSSTAEPQPTPNTTELTAAIDQAHAALMNNPTALAYLQGRGLTLDTITRHKIGYSDGGQNALLQGNNKQFQSKSRKAGLYKYIFPVLDQNGSCYYYISEISDRAQIDDYNGKYMKLKNTPQRFFNESCISCNEIIFICEGVYDALSIEQAGGRAIAITGTGGNSRLLELASKPGASKNYIIALDSDTAGLKAARSIKQAMKGSGKRCFIAPITQAKDANELLQKDPKALADYVKSSSKMAFEEWKREEQRKMQAAEQPQNVTDSRFDSTRAIIESLLNEKGLTSKADLDELTKEVIERENEPIEYQKTTAAARCQEFMNNIINSTYQRPISTGFTSLDSKLDGGIYPGGLYFIGAISSLGKTSFVLQIADNIAAAGHDVLFFSLEMSEFELMARSVSRLTLLEDMRQYKTTEHAKSTRGILRGSNYKYHTAEEQKVIQSALESYEKNYGNNLRIIEGVGTIGIEEIKKAVEKHIRNTNNTPVIVIDYLQILSPADIRATDKQNTDKAVLELKRLARDKNIAVIGISSFNRNNYTDPVNMASFKESGAIEYSSDVLIGLQYFGMDYVEGEGEKERDKRVRELQKSEEEKGRSGQAENIQIKVLKQRNFSKGDVLLNFYPCYNYYVENTLTDTERDTAIKSSGKSARQKELESLLAALREVESVEGSNTASLEALADKLDLKKATVKNKLKEYTKHFTITGDLVTYNPKNAEDQTDTEPLF